MKHFNRTHLKHIKARFSEETGVTLAPTASAFRPRFVLLAAVVLILAMGLVSCAPLLFNSISGDEVSFCSEYLGDGIVAIRIENSSGKTLHFQPRLRLERWAEGQEIPAHGKVSFTGRKIPANSTGTMTLDLSRAYDIAELEKPLHNDSYYFVLTNNNFAFGQDWMCSVAFAENITDPPVYPEPISPAQADPELVGQAVPELQDFFQEAILTDIEKRAALTAAYYERCTEFIRDSGLNVLRPVSPAPAFLYGDPPAGTVLDPNIPEAEQYQLISIHEASVDSYFFPVGAGWEDTAKIFEVIVPQSQLDLTRVQGDAIEIGYVMIYDAAQCQTSDAWALIRGQLVSIEQLSQNIVYQDETYIAFDVTDCFFTDLDTHIAAFRQQRQDLFFNDDVITRIENAYQYLHTGGMQMERYAG